jgi:ParB family chromosome partitioning protein
MAKRRNLEIPSSAELAQMEAEFRRETAMSRVNVAPIAQVAAETAAAFDPRGAEERAEAARDRVVATEFRAAQDRGLVMLELALDQIDADALVRDRVVIDTDELEELKASIARNGLRLPVEVFAQAPAGQGADTTRFGLLSGYRRLMAIRALREATRDPRYDKVKAVLREPEAMGGSFAAMVEENEIRAGLSHFERGRITVIASQQGAFANVEAAVDALFPVASKAKRSKIRSFALIFEELGDLLRFPDQIKEREGLRIAQALRDGGETRLRAGLARSSALDAEDEARQIAAILAELDTPRPDPRKGGRPCVTLSSGHVLSAEHDAHGWSIRLGGEHPVERDLVEALIEELRLLLDSRPIR